MIRDITSEAVKSLRIRVKEYLTDKRYAHTLAVEKEAAKLAAIYLPDKENEIRAAALLHDITKRWDDAKQLQYCRDFGIILNMHESRQTKTIHAKTAAEFVKNVFSEFASENVVNGVRYHTTGHSGMTVFESIIYLADFIEETRTYDDCVKLRRYFYDRIAAAASDEEKRTVLVDTMIFSFDITMLGLIENAEYIDSFSAEARNYFIAVREGVTNMEIENG